MTSSVMELDDTSKKEWDSFVDNHPDGKVYHLTKWKKLIEDEFGHQGKYYYLKNLQTKKIEGLCPAIAVKSALFGKNLISLPYFNYGAPLTTSSKDFTELTKALIQFAQDNNFDYAQIRQQNDHNACHLAVSTHKVNMILELPESPDILGKQIGSKKRSQIRRPAKEGVSHQFGHLDLLDDFYTVYSTNMRDLGTPVYSKSFFSNILQSFSERTKICVVYWQGAPVAGGFLIGYKDTLEIPWASTLRYANKISVNMYLYWEILSYAIEHNYRYFDFGRSTVDSGTYKFKKQWGAQPQQSYWLHWVPNGKPLPNLSPDNDKFGLAIKVWQKLPISVANFFGPFISKSLP